MNLIANTISVLASLPILFYMFPITAAVSLVYSGSRFEDPRLILKKSFRLFMQIIVLLLGILLLLYVFSLGM